MSALNLTLFHILLILVLAEFGIIFHLLLLHFGILLGSYLVDLAADFHTIGLGDALDSLTVLGLHVNENGLAINHDISDFDGLKPYTPSLNYFAHFVAYLLTERLTFTQNLYCRRVSDSSAHNSL